MVWNLSKLTGQDQPIDVRRARFFKRTRFVVGLFIAWSVLAVLRIWWAIHTGEIWKNSLGIASSGSEMRGMLFLFGGLGIVAAVARWGIIKWEKRG